MDHKFAFGWVFLFGLLLTGCSQIKYSALEQVGIHKRDILVDRVEETQDAQEDSKDTIIDAYEAFKTVVNVDGGDLETQYKRLRDAVNESQDASDSLRARIDSVAEVSEDLFDEWQAELEQYSNESLRRASAASLSDARANYAVMIRQMDKAYDRIQPVLTVLNDQVLFLKHNLNARAVQAIEGELIDIESKVEVLIVEMDAAIAEAGEFIAQMESN